jgi:spore coat protein U-like protein
MLRNFKMRSILGILLAVVLFAGISVPAFAATTQDVTVTATPTFISIANAPATMAFGAVAAGGSAVSGQAHFTITNTSSVPIDITIAAQTANWTGGLLKQVYGLEHTHRIGLEIM